MINITKFVSILCFAPRSTSMEVVREVLSIKDLMETLLLILLTNVQGIM